MFAVLLSGLLSVAQAGTLAGVTVPDTATVGGQALVLNGMGLREKFFFDIYVGSLYLPTKTTSSTTAITEDTAKRITMSFIYGKVTKDQVNEAFDEALANQADKAAALKDRFEKLKGWMGDILSGESMQYDYVPGTGTTVTVKGVVKGTIEGKDFMEALWSVYIGPKPATAALKAGMLGAN